MAERRDELSEEGELEERPEIMTKPLPQILDEIEESIKLANEAAKNA
nr:hypothetical protein [Candidatus Saccharibacteria bacterium]